jgi:hypothetical protein
MAFGSYPKLKRERVTKAFSYHFEAELVSMIAGELSFSQKALALLYIPRKKKVTGII